MIDMCVRKKYIINQLNIYRKSSIFKYIHPLLHTIIDKYVLCAYPQVMTAASYLMIGSDKFQFHLCPLAAGFPAGYFYRKITS